MSRSAKTRRSGYDSLTLLVISLFHARNRCGAICRCDFSKYSVENDSLCSPPRAGAVGDAFMQSFRWGIVALSLCNAYGQVTPAQTAFDVAEIKLNKSGQTDNDYFTIQPGGVFIAHHARISEVFQYAFKVRRDAISGAPSWFDADRVDIAAKASGTTNDENLRAMLQLLLTTEFNIAMHSNQKSMNAFVLVASKGGAKLQKTVSSEPADCKRVGDQGATFGGTHLACTNMKIAELAQGLPDLAPGYLDKPVVDRTGLTEAYDFSLDWVGRKSAEVDGGPTIFTAVEKLGLKFEQRKVPLPVIVIDHMDRLSNTF